MPRKKKPTPGTRAPRLSIDKERLARIFAEIHAGMRHAIERLDPVETLREMDRRSEELLSDDRGDTQEAAVSAVGLETDPDGRQIPIILGPTSDHPAKVWTARGEWVEHKLTPERYAILCAIRDAAVQGRTIGLDRLERVEVRGTSIGASGIIKRMQRHPILKAVLVCQRRGRGNGYVFRFINGR